MKNYMLNIRQSSEKQPLEINLKKGKIRPIGLSTNSEKHLEIPGMKRLVDFILPREMTRFLTQTVLKS